MDVKQAYELLMQSPKANKKVAVRCYEYNSLFVFDMRRPERLDKQLLDSALTVDKKTGRIGVFQPFKMSMDEYNAGKEVKNFK